jgi:hypothetical protein
MVAEGRGLVLLGFFHSSLAPLVCACVCARVLRACVLSVHLSVCLSSCLSVSLSLSLSLSLWVGNMPSHPQTITSSRVIRAPVPCPQPLASDSVSAPAGLLPRRHPHPVARAPPRPLPCPQAAPTPQGTQGRPRAQGNTHMMPYPPRRPPRCRQQRRVRAMTRCWRQLSARASAPFWAAPSLQYGTPPRVRRRRLGERVWEVGGGGRRRRLQVQLSW